MKSNPDNRIVEFVGLQFSTNYVAMIFTLMIMWELVQIKNLQYCASGTWAPDARDWNHGANVAESTPIGALGSFTWWGYSNCEALGPDFLNLNVVDVR